MRKFAYLDLPLDGRVGGMFRNAIAVQLGGLSRRRRLRTSEICPGVVGPVLGGDGTTPGTGRQGKTGESTVGQAHGKYYEPSSRGVLFAASDQGGGVTCQTTITTTGLLSLYNPAGSVKRLAIKKISLGYVSGTLGAGSFYHAFNAIGAAAPTGGTALTANSADIGNQSAVTAVGVPRTGATVVAATVLYPFASSFVELATTANPLQLIIEDVDGAITIEPGCTYQLVSVLGAGGSSPKVSPGVLWEEIPIVASQG